MSQFNLSYLSHESISRQEIKLYKLWGELTKMENLVKNDWVMSMRVKNMKQNLLCSYKLKLIYPELEKSTNSLMENGFVVPKLDIERWNYQQFNLKIDVLEGSKLYDKYNIRHISLSIPPDAMGNRVDSKYDNCSPVKLPSTLEIALIDKMGKLNYNHPECYDVLRYDSIGEIIKDILRIKNFDDGNSKIIIKFKINEYKEELEKITIKDNASLRDLRKSVINQLTNYYKIDNFQNWFKGKNIYLETMRKTQKRCNSVAEIVSTVSLVKDLKDYSFAVIVTKSDDKSTSKISIDKNITCGGFKKTLSSMYKIKKNKNFTHWSQWFKENKISIQFTKNKLKPLPDSVDNDINSQDIVHESVIVVC